MALLGDGGDALVGWPGWQPLPGLVAAAGGRAVPVAPAPAALPARAAARARGRSLHVSPRDPTGAAAPAPPLRDAVRAACPST